MGGETEGGGKHVSQQQASRRPPPPPPLLLACVRPSREGANTRAVRYAPASKLGTALRFSTRTSVAHAASRMTGVGAAPPRRSAAARARAAAASNSHVSRGVTGEE